MKSAIASKPHYSYATRMLLDLFNSGELPEISEVHVEPEYGYAVRIKYTNGKVHTFKGGPGVNKSGPNYITSDKAYSKYFLNHLGYKVPKGKAFLMKDFVDKIDVNLRKYDFKEYASSETSFEYAENLGYPVFVKRNFGTHGINIFRCENAEDLESAINIYQESGVKIFVVEENVNMSNYRVLVCNDNVELAYMQIPLSVTGDGVSDIEKLLEEKQNMFDNKGQKVNIEKVKPQITNCLDKKSLTLNSILSSEEKVQVIDVSNTSSGGEPIDVTDKIHKNWENLCINISSDLGLVLAGVDICCEDITKSNSDYRILEVNASPGVSNYASSGKEQEKRAKNVYIKIFNELIPRTN